MQKPKLVIIAGDQQGKEFFIESFPFKIGRMPDNNIVFSDRRVSRYHSELVCDSGKYIIKDLGSQNGTWLNGAKITSAEIKTGDSIVIGGAAITVNLESAKKEDIFEDTDTSSGFRTTIRPVKEILKGAIEQKDTEDSSVEVLKKRNEMLSALYQISKDILKESEIDSILNLTADTILSNINAERVYVLMKDENTGSINVRLEKDTREKCAKQDKLMLSKTVINRVMDEEIAVLVADARTDARFKESESIILYGIRSAMCVPLLGAERVAGSIYVDVVSTDRRFTSEELDLLTTIGNLAAIAIEQTHLREKILKEIEARQSMMRYHSPQVVEEIIKGKGDCKVAEKTITVLFVDIQGFTKLSDKLGPMGTAELLNEYFDIITDAVFRYNGTIDKFIGDAAMAIFGAPFQEKNYTEMAVRAAVDIQREIIKRSKFKIRIGINTGQAVIGNIGSTKRVDYTAIGDTVNIASRLEGLAKQDKIYIGEETYRQIKDIFKIKPVGRQKVKGKTTEVSIYEVLVE